MKYELYHLKLNVILRKISVLITPQYMLIFNYQKTTLIMHHVI